MIEDDKELQQFAERLADALPKMAPESLARVKEQLDAEMDQQGRRRQTKRRVILGFCVAATIALAIVSYVISRPAHDVGSPAGPAPALAVHDRVQIVSSAPTPNTDSSKPVVALEDYRSLYVD